MSTQLDAMLVAGTIPMVIGDCVDAAPTSRGIPIFDPSRGEQLCHVQQADSEQISRAVALARDTIDSGRWPGSPRFRARLMTKLAELVERDADLLSGLDTEAVGLATHRARDEISAIVEDLEYFAGWCTKHNGDYVPVSNPATMALTIPQPLGICVALTSWNWPMEGFSAKVAPAIAAGNCVIVKPSEQGTPSVVWLARLALEAGFPPGVISVVTGDGPEVGGALVADPRIDAVSFTGSTTVGERVALAARRRGKKLSLQLSGTCYALVYPDADVEAAANRLVASAFDHSGQNCIAPSRLFVHSDVSEDFLGAATVAVQNFVVGDPRSTRSNAGPLISSKSRDRVTAALADARASGARVVAEAALDGSVSPNGYYMRPQLLTNVPLQHPLVAEEIFGPVLTVATFYSQEESIMLGRNMSSALAAGIWSKNLNTARTAARQLSAGTIWVNGYGVYDSGMPTGGWGHSGLGRELGREALDFYTRRQSLWFVETGA